MPGLGGLLQQLQGGPDILTRHEIPARLHGKAEGHRPHSRGFARREIKHLVDQVLHCQREAIAETGIGLGKEFPRDLKSVSSVDIDPEADKPIEDRGRQMARIIGRCEPQDVTGVDRHIQELVDKVLGILTSSSECSASIGVSAGLSGAILSISSSNTKGLAVAPSTSCRAILPGPAAFQAGLNPVRVDPRSVRVFMAMDNEGSPNASASCRMNQVLPFPGSPISRQGGRRSGVPVFAASPVALPIQSSTPEKCGARGRIAETCSIIAPVGTASDRVAPIGWISIFLCHSRRFASPSSWLS